MVPLTSWWLKLSVLVIVTVGVAAKYSVGVLVVVVGMVAAASAWIGTSSVGLLDLRALVDRRRCGLKPRQ
jgi:hypothetical protein